VDTLSTDLYAVTPEEDARYNDFCRHSLLQLLRPVPESLWYYTTAATFARIMDTREIWSTQISCLNDHTEFRYSVRLLREAMRAYKDNKYPDGVRWLAGYIDDALEDDGADYSWFFVMCMSEAKDDLSQWRAYSGGENGVAIELCTPLLAPNTQCGGLLVPVCYSEERQKALAAEIAKWTIQYFLDGMLIRQRTGAEVDQQKWADSFLVGWARQDHLLRADSERQSVRKRA
jgi:hypothetical protein